MKSVLISIQPKWCELIVKGEKTVEVRKTKPKLEEPFKVYIYCTKGHFHKDYSDTAKAWKENVLGKVIGEFVCDGILDIYIEVSKPDDLPGYPFPCTGLTDKEILQYLGNGKAGYGWHISDLVIYGEPKLLSEFTKPYGTIIKAFDSPYIQRPPQSWCYVEELNDGLH